MMVEVLDHSLVNNVSSHAKDLFVRSLLLLDTSGGCYLSDVASNQETRERLR